jgi:hypothetical protein
MDVKVDLLLNPGHSTVDFLIIDESSVSNYLVDPNISVSDMIEQVEIKSDIFVISSCCSTRFR